MMLRRPIKMTLAAAAASTALGVAACRTVPQTGRKQLILVSEGQETQMGVTAYEDALKTAKLSTDPAKLAQLERVGKRIAAAANKPDYKWEFKLIDDDKTVNAFCLPGGKIAVYSGLLPVAANDHGLAAVLGHEVAHATLRHGAERASQGLLAQLGESALMTGLGQRDPKVLGAVQLAYGIGTQVGVLLPFSRDHESEADRVGLEYMAKAGYEPEEAIQFWKRMSAQGGAGAPEFLSTHPSHEKRIADLEKALPRARQLYRPQ